jgi:voltage-gated potassium channel
LRVFYALRALQLLRLVGLAAKVGDLIRDLFGRRGMPYALLVGGILILSSTIAVTVAERGHGGTIDNFGTALWWAIVTATTVGYGDVAPITPAGRGIAVFVMCVGITLFGLFTANVAAFILQSGGGSNDRKEVTLGEIAEQLQRLEAQVAEIRESLANQGVVAPVLGSNGAEESSVDASPAGTRQ